MAGVCAETLSSEAGCPHRHYDLPTLVPKPVTLLGTPTFTTTHHITPQHSFGLRRSSEPLAGRHVEQPTRRLVVQGFCPLWARVTRSEPASIHRYQQLLRAAEGQWRAGAIIAYAPEHAAAEEAAQGLQALQADGRGCHCRVSRHASLQQP
jgi:hypothetical protein